VRHSVRNWFLMVRRQTLTPLLSIGVHKSANTLS
jgi:hypothetical protein